MCAWGTSWSCWLFGLLVGRPKIFLPVALGCTYQVYSQHKQHQPPELSGHQAIEEEIEGTVEQSHHIHQLTQRCVTVHEKLRWKLDQQISKKLLYTAGPKKCPIASSLILMLEGEFVISTPILIKYSYIWGIFLGHTVFENHLFPKGSRENIKNALRGQTWNLLSTLGKLSKTT